jgi:ATP-binding cassette subfamily B multidrug efflux pump
MKELLWPYVRRHWLRYAFGFLCLVVTASLAMTVPYLVRFGINSIQRGELARLPGLAGEIGLVAVLMALARWFSRFVVFNCGRDVEYELRKDLFTRLLLLGPEFYRAFGTGDLMSRLVNDLTAVRLLVGFGILTFINAPLYYLYALAIMLSLNAPLTLAALSPFVLLLLVVRRLARSLMERSLEVQQGLGQISAKVQESLLGIHVVKAYTLEEHEARVFAQQNELYNRKGLALARLRGAITPLMRIAASLSVLTVLTYGGYFVLERRMTVGDLAGFMGYLTLLATPTALLGWVISIYQRGRAAVSRLSEILSAPATLALDNDSVFEVTGEIEWEHVSFSYFDCARNGADGAAPWALKDVAVKVPAGSKLAIVGRTGAGKSTMVNLLFRLIEPSQGRVLLDGCDLRTIPLRALRRAIGAAVQNPTLFSDTLYRNIALGRPSASPAEIAAAARAAGLESELATLPDGLQTVVGERGTSLSGGQKQRVAIARMIVYDAPVAVLDDALSSVDTVTEAGILRNLNQRMEGRTTIVVSHRISSIRDADQIVVLDRGVVVERGTHDELMAAGGIYAELFRRQLLEEELERY